MKKTRTRRRRTDSPRRQPSNLIRRVDAARLRGISRASVTEACRPRASLYGAARGAYLDRTAPEFEPWLAAGQAALAAPELRERSVRKKRAEIAALELKLRRDQGELIERALVKRYLFGYLEALSIRLLRDMPQTLASQVSSRTRANATNEEITTFIREVLSRELTETKRRIIGSMRGDRDEAVEDDARAAAAE